MAQNHNCYAIIGNNGYGMSSDWPDIVSYAKLLESEWHRGFQTEDDAYDWLVEQVGMRSRLNANGICDLDTLRSQRLVIIDNVQRPVKETFCRKPAEMEEVRSIEELDQALDEIVKNKVSKKAITKKERKKALVKHFEKWLDTYLDD